MQGRGVSTANTIQYEWQWKVLWEHREWRDSFSQRELVKKFSRQGKDILGEAHGVCEGPLSWSCTAFIRNHQESITACKWVSKWSTERCGWKGGSESNRQALCTCDYKGMSWPVLNFRNTQTTPPRGSTNRLPLSSPANLPDSWSSSLEPELPS